LEALVGPTPSFWRGKRVLLTGHTGFKGAWAWHWLRQMGAQVHGLALAPDTQPSLAALTGLVDDPRSTIGDIRDTGLLARLFGDIAPDIVLHLAAQALVRRSYREPLETFSTNVMGTLALLDAASKQQAVRSFVAVTTDKCYVNRERPEPYREDEPLGGHDPYSASKACAEIAVAAWRASLPDMADYDRSDAPLHIATARAGNVFGGGDWAQDRLVPDFFRAMATGATLVIRNPAARRPWQHVLEPLCGYLMLAERLWRGEAAEAWNFGPALDDVQPVSFLADRLRAASGGTTGWRVEGGHYPHEAGLLALDAAKAREGLGWRPRLPLGEGLDWTCEWHRRLAQGEDAAALTDEQIARYMALAPAPVA
jgi:CDP-glucose 4,6-dehydratase